MFIFLNYPSRAGLERKKEAKYFRNSRDLLIWSGRLPERKIVLDLLHLKIVRSRCVAPGRMI